MMNFKPLYDKIIVRRITQETARTASGIYLSEPDIDHPFMGIVVAIGDGKITPSGITLPMEVSVGDKILFSPHVGVKLEDEVLLMREEEVLCVIIE